MTKDAVTSKLASVGIIGYGSVGRATELLFKKAVIFDPPKGYDDPTQLQKCPVSFVCVPTPTGRDGRCDLRLVHDAVKSVAPLLSDSQVLAIRSTVPPGTARQLQEEYSNTHIASNPEFLRSHRLKEDALRPFRVVIGGDSVYARQLLLRTYHSRLTRRVPYIVTDSITAELIKYIANSFLSVKISYAHQIRRAAARLGADYDEVVRAVGLDPRIGSGDEWFLDRLDDECLPKDLRAFVSLLRSWNTERWLLEAVLAHEEERFSIRMTERPAPSGT